MHERSTKKDCINTIRIRTIVSAKPVGKKAKSQKPTGSTFHASLSKIPSSERLRKRSLKANKRMNRKETSGITAAFCFQFPIFPCSTQLFILTESVICTTLPPLDPQKFGSYPIRLHASIIQGPMYQILATSHGALQLTLHQYILLWLRLYDLIKQRRLSQKEDSELGSRLHLLFASLSPIFSFFFIRHVPACVHPPARISSLKGILVTPQK